MSFYLAAQFGWKESIAAKKEQLTKMGFFVTSTWTDEQAKPDCSLKDFTGDYHESMASRDLNEIEAADVLVLFTVDPDTMTRRGGRHVEFGYALGRGKSVIIVGPKENIFHHLPKVRQFETWDDFIGALKCLK